MSGLCKIRWSLLYVSNITLISSSCIECSDWIISGSNGPCVILEKTVTWCKINYGSLFSLPKIGNNCSVLLAMKIAVSKEII